MAVAALVTVSCDGALDVGCTADGGDPFHTIGQAVRALRAGGWTFPAKYAGAPFGETASRQQARLGAWPWYWRRVKLDELLARAVGGQVLRWFERRPEASWPAILGWLDKQVTEAEDEALKMIARQRNPVEAIRVR